MLTPGEVLAVKAGPDDTLPTYRHLVLNWLLAHHYGLPLVVEGAPHGLNWLEVPYRDGPAASSRPRVAAAWDRRPGDLEVGEFATDVELDTLHQEGFLSEVVLCALAQTGWRRGDWAHITRGELLIRFTPDGLLKEPVAYSAESWREFNRVRLQELAPSELLAAVRPFLGEGGDARELEAAILLCVDEVEDLVQLASRLRA